MVGFRVFVVTKERAVSLSMKREAKSAEDYYIYS